MKFGRFVIQVDGVLHSGNSIVENMFRALFVFVVVVEVCAVGVHPSDVIIVRSIVAIFLRELREVSGRIRECFFIQRRSGFL